MSRWERFKLSGLVSHWTGQFEEGSDTVENKTPTKEEIFVKEFDDLDPIDLMKMSNKALHVANYVKIKLLNGCVTTNSGEIKDLKKFNSKLIWGAIITVLLLLLSIGVTFAFRFITGD